MLRSGKINKRAVSEIISYVILVVIALGISVFVYSYLKFMIPKETPACPDGINLIVDDYSCSVSALSLNLTILNKGLFKVDAVYIRFGPLSQKIKPPLNKNDIRLVDSTAKGYGLNPGSKSFLKYPVSISSSENYGIEIEPAIISEGKPILCEKAIITQPISCN